MLTVEQFLKAGFKFVVGDKICTSDKQTILISTSEELEDYLNMNDADAKECCIEELVWRNIPKNNKLPVSNDCWIQYKTCSNYGDSIAHTSKPKYINLPKHTCTTIKWRPSIEYTLAELRNKKM